jgi:hypothetical protein
VNCPTLPINLSFWVKLVGACNSIWYRSQRSRVRILVSAIKLNNCRSLLLHFWGLRKPRCEGECWNISELPTSPYQLKLLGWTGRCMQLNSIHSCAALYYIDITLFNTSFALRYELSAQNLCIFVIDQLELLVHSLMLLSWYNSTGGQALVKDCTMRWTGVFALLVAGVPCQRSYNLQKVLFLLPWTQLWHWQSGAEDRISDFFDGSGLYY